MGGIRREYLDDETYTEQDQVLIEMAARGAPHSELAKAAGLSVRQVQRKLSEPKFRQAIKKFCRDLFAMRMRHVQSHWEKMENCFVSILDDEDTDTYAKIAAATQIKGMCFQARELDIEDEMDELRDRIVDIEQRVSGVGVTVGLLEAPNADDD